MVADPPEGEGFKHYERDRVHVVCEEEEVNWLGIEDHLVSFAGERASSFFSRALDVTRRSVPYRKGPTAGPEFTGLPLGVPNFQTTE